MKTRQQLLAQVKQQVSRRLGREPRDLASYVRRYNAEFSRPWTRSSHEELTGAVAAADIVLGADFHAFAQSQRIHLRILRALPARRQVILAVEAIAAGDQASLDRYMAGDLSERDFLQRVKWNQRWGFPWENYKPLFELARTKGYKVVGINTAMGRKGENSLVRRDRFCATVITRWRKRCPDALIYVVIGDLHLAKRHLPSALVRPGKSGAPGQGCNGY